MLLEIIVSSGFLILCQRPGSDWDKRQPSGSSPGSHILSAEEDRPPLTWPLPTRIWNSSADYFASSSLWLLTFMAWYLKLITRFPVMREMRHVVQNLAQCSSRMGNCRALHLALKNQAPKQSFFQEKGMEEGIPKALINPAMANSKAGVGQEEETLNALHHYTSPLDCWRWRWGGTPLALRVFIHCFKTQEVLRKDVSFQCSRHPQLKSAAIPNPYGYTQSFFRHMRPLTLILLEPTSLMRSGRSPLRWLSTVIAPSEASWKESFSPAGQQS